MIIVIAGIIIALFILQLGRWLGRREAEQAISRNRSEMGLDIETEEGNNENTSGDTQD